MREQICNPLKRLEASTGIEPVYTDLQSAASPLRQLAAVVVASHYLIPKISARVLVRVFASRWALFGHRICVKTGKQIYEHMSLADD